MDNIDRKTLPASDHRPMPARWDDASERNLIDAVCNRSSPPWLIPGEQG